MPANQALTSKNVENILKKPPGGARLWLFCQVRLGFFVWLMAKKGMGHGQWHRVVYEYPHEPPMLI